VPNVIGPPQRLLVALGQCGDCAGSADRRKLSVAFASQLGAGSTRVHSAVIVYSDRSPNELMESQGKQILKKLTDRTPAPAP